MSENKKIVKRIIKRVIKKPVEQPKQIEPPKHVEPPKQVIRPPLEKSPYKVSPIPANKLPSRIVSAGLRVKYHGKNVHYMKYSQAEGNYKLDYKTVREFANNLSIGSFNKGIRGQMMVSINFGGRIGHRSGYFTEIGGLVSLYGPGDSDEEITDAELNNIKDFTVFFIVENKVGGCGDFNDCLYDCLNEVLGNLRPFETPREMKEFLKIKRTDGVNIDDMKKIDDELGDKYRITVSGDYVYNSTKKSRYEIRLKLLDNHYTVDRENRIRITHYDDKIKRLIMYDKQFEGKGKDKQYSYVVYDGKNKETFTTEGFFEFKDLKYKTSNDTILIKAFDDCKTIEESLEKFHRIAKGLKEKTNGVIDMYKTGTYAKTALKRFDELTKHIYVEPILQNEAEILIKSISGAVVYAEKGYEGPAYKYDFNSMYGSILCKKEFLIPIKEGQFISISKLPSILKYGMYHCDIEFVEKSLFKFNRDKWYTHIDIYTARYLKLNIKLIIDDKPNGYIYERDCLLNSHFIFEKFVMEFFNLKKKGVEGSKNIGNCLWGALCQKTVYPKKLKLTDEYNFPQDSTITSINPLSNDMLVIEYYYNRKIFETHYARVGPFLLAKGREKIIKAAQPYYSHVKRIHTDSITSDIKLPIEHSSALGEMKYEGYCENVIISNCIVTTGKFIIN